MIQATEKVITYDDIRIHLTLLSMHRTFLLVLERDGYSTNFDQTSPLEGLSMAIGEYSSPIYNSGDPLASSSLAARLSKSCNKSKPVYVANNSGASEEITSNLYMNIFQFVKANYKPGE